MNNNKILTNNMQLTQHTLPIIEQIANQMPGGFFIYKADENEELIFANESLFEIFGCDSKEEFEQLTGNTFKGMVHPDDLDEVESSILSQIATNTRNNDYVEYRIIRRDGSIRYVDDYGHFAHTEDYGDVYYVFINDATDKRLAAELEKMRHINKAKRSFLFNISHDIRTPMNSIMGFTVLAMQNLGNPELLADYLGKVNVSARHMMSLIDDVIEMNSIESELTEITNVECRIAPSVCKSIDLIRPYAEEKNISIEQDLKLPDEYVNVDDIRLRKVISRLLENAVKFTPNGGKVTVSAVSHDVSVPGYTRYEIKIRDNGIGMSEEFLTRIFQPFEREETSTKTGYPGIGLGLSIVRSLLDLMGGSINVESKKGNGSTFTVSLPLMIAKQQEAGTDNEKKLYKTEYESHISSHRILLVEDIEINRFLAETVLQKYGYIVESVTDGSYAVEAVKKHDEWYYDLILMDIQMPIMDGYEATKAIRALGRSDSGIIPIIALSANASAADRTAALESGMNMHIAKPYEIDDLISAVKKFSEPMNQVSI